MKSSQSEIVAYPLAIQYGTTLSAVLNIIILMHKLLYIIIKNYRVGNNIIRLVFALQKLKLRRRHLMADGLEVE